MKAITTRKNKYYTTVLIHECDVITFRKAVEVANKIDRPTIIKPTTKAIESYRLKTKEKQLLIETPVGNNFKIWGVTFKVIDQQPGSCVNGNVTLKWKNKNGVDETFMMFYDQTLIEKVFARTTGSLLYF